MAHIIDDELWVCIDCLMIIANDDASGMDDATEARIRSAIARINGYIVCGDETDEFSHNRCDVCNGLPGALYRCAILGD